MSIISIVPNIYSQLQPGQDDDSDSTCEEMHRQRNKRSSAVVKVEPSLQSFDSKSYKEERDSRENRDSRDSDENLWMTATQFSQLLDKQEALENLGYAKLHKQKSLSVIQKDLNSVSAASGDVLGLKPTISPSSYLDSEAMLPLAKMKQVSFYVKLDYYLNLYETLLKP